VDAVDPGDAGAAGDLAERMLAAMGG